MGTGKGTRESVSTILVWMGKKRHFDNVSLVVFLQVHRKKFYFSILLFPARNRTRDFSYNMINLYFFLVPVPAAKKRWVENPPPLIYSQTTKIKNTYNISDIQSEIICKEVLSCRFNKRLEKILNQRAIVVIIQTDQSIILIDIILN